LRMRISADDLLALDLESSRSLEKNKFGKVIRW
jgi:hypothetical protein